MSATLTADDANLLVKLCGMLGSAHIGERAAAAAKADQLLRSRGLRWNDVIVTPSQATTTKSAKRSPWPPPPEWWDQLTFCLDHRDLLTEREQDFVDSLRHWRGRPTEKQAKWLLDIYWYVFVEVEE
jgi:hypothetical protein